ncbi:V-set and immunoglobulin domain-containing protein 10-like isoform X2 [Takifugu rubripes]|uniref:V-set and immunoglobulin domain-containing protein 10-like isoform X2 n=1 Tax=Takifugu rubripes TaxID=31033 RepID=UPI001145CEC5|nr:V-set and immunoglobulin domain-containing protein 10-like isoform X2 [Takifugu rubripes]
MMQISEYISFKSVFLLILLCFSYQGAHCELVVSPAGPSDVKVLAGSQVTLAVSFSGASDPVVTWFIRDLPVVTWTIASFEPPDIAADRRTVLRIESNGSLTFLNVPVSYTDSYTVEMTKSGLGKSRTTFSLKVYDNIKNVLLSMQPDFATEGAARFTLHYSILQGVVEQQMWLFHGIEINSNSHYSVENRSLVVLKPTRNDTGQYTLLLTNPFSSATAHSNVTVRYGPDEPTLEAHPAKPFYISGDSLALSCRADGFPQPTVEWLFGGQTVSHARVLNITDVQTSQGGEYTCLLRNEETIKQREKIIHLKVYERPLGTPVCSVQSVNNTELQYQCQWLAGSPPAQLSFPVLSNSSSGAAILSLNVTAVNTLDGKPVTCIADHPVEKTNCDITARSPAKFLPAVRTTVDSEGKIVVSIRCVSEASPTAAVLWTDGHRALTNGTTYQIITDATQLNIHHYNVSNFLLNNYTCVCRNPLGSQTRQTRLKGPSISDSSLFPNQNGTIITLTWEVPPMSIVTGFDIQMKGPGLLSQNHHGIEDRSASSRFHTIQQKPGSARSTDVFYLDPDLTYRFRVIPKARVTEGEPSKVLKIGPGGGLSGPAIAGIAAGIPCSLLVLLLLLGVVVYLWIYCDNKRSQRTRYPLSRGGEKEVLTLPQITTGYSRLLLKDLWLSPTLSPHHPSEWLQLSKTNSYSRTFYNFILF